MRGSALRKAIHGGMWNLPTYTGFTTGAWCRCARLRTGRTHFVGLASINDRSEKAAPEPTCRYAWFNEAWCLLAQQVLRQAEPALDESLSRHELQNQGADLLDPCASM